MKNKFEKVTINIIIVIIIMIVISAGIFCYTYRDWIKKEASKTPDDTLQEFVLSEGGNVGDTPQKEIYRNDFVRPLYLKDSDVLWLYVSEPDSVYLSFPNGEEKLDLSDHEEHYINGWAYKVVYEEVTGYIPVTGKRVYIYPGQYINESNNFFKIKGTFEMDLRLAHAGKSDYAFTWDERDNGQGKEIQVNYDENKITLTKIK